jgi:hypothetical protein
MTQESATLDTVLPSIYKHNYSSHKRPRRGMVRLPAKYRDTVIQCVEFPDGVYINEDGIPKPQQSLESPDSACDEFDEISDDEFENLHPKKKRQLLNKLKWQHRKAEQEERENIQDQAEGAAEIYEMAADLVDKDFIDYMKGDVDYLPEDDTSSDDDDDEEDLEDDEEEEEEDILIDKDHVDEEDILMDKDQVDDVEEDLEDVEEEELSIEIKEEEEEDEE